MRVRNNRMTDPKFCIDISERLNKIEQYLLEHNNSQENPQKQSEIQSTKSTQEEETQQITAEHMAQLSENYENVSAQEREKGVKILRQLREKIKNIIYKKEGEGFGK
jgi:hypothetical protein